MAISSWKPRALPVAFLLSLAARAEAWAQRIRSLCATAENGMVLLSLEAQAALSSGYRARKNTPKGEESEGDRWLRELLNRAFDQGLGEGIARINTDTWGGFNSPSAKAEREAVEAAAKAEREKAEAEENAKRAKAREALLEVLADPKSSAKKRAEAIQALRSMM